MISQEEEMVTVPEKESTNTRRQTGGGCKSDTV